jgi:serine/threonine-protein kinase
MSDPPVSTTVLRDTLAAALGERYDDVRQIGQGGMAVVFRAVDRRLDRTVAIKVMSPSLREDAEARARFMREAKAVAALAHTNVVPI